MPKTTVFNPMYGYIRHPEDVDHLCFWCGAHTILTNTWDYTPHRTIAKHPELMARIDQQPYAVKACHACVSKSTYRKIELTTMDKKRVFFGKKSQEAAAELSKLSGKIVRGWEIWQIRLEDGTFADLPDDMCSEPQLLAKNEFYNKVVPRTEDSVNFGAPKVASGIENGAPGIESPKIVVPDYVSTMISTVSPDEGS